MASSFTKGEDAGFELIRKLVDLNNGKIDESTYSVIRKVTEPGLFRPHRSSAAPPRHPPPVPL
jgi:hypothetical protein